MAQSRSLTQDERDICGQIFRDSIPLDLVTITVRQVVFGGYTPYGDINVGPESYQGDFIAPVAASKGGADEIDDAHFFLHEMTHVWQHHVGMPVALHWMQARAAGRRVLRRSGKPRIAFYRDAATYAYDITPDQSDLLDYTMEQQCDIVADHFAKLYWNRPLDAGHHNVFGYATPSGEQLRAVLARFLEDPGYPAREPGLWRARARYRRRAADEDDDGGG